MSEPKNIPNRCTRPVNAAGDHRVRVGNPLDITKKIDVVPPIGRPHTTEYRAG